MFSSLDLINRCFFVFTEMKSQLDIAQHQINRQSTSLVEKERECVKRVQAAHEEEWQKLHVIENEK